MATSTELGVLSTRPDQSRTNGSPLFGRVDLVCVDLVCVDLVCVDLVCVDLVCVDLVCVEDELE